MTQAMFYFKNQHKNEIYNMKIYIILMIFKQSTSSDLNHLIK
jgi:hypothetical protein